jgi:hypothetical protein
MKVIQQVWQGLIGHIGGWHLILLSPMIRHQLEKYDCAQLPSNLNGTALGIVVCGVIVVRYGTIHLAFL